MDNDQSNDAFSHIERLGPLVENVLAQITDAIVTGRLQPGDKLVETTLAEQLGVSRGPVRDALRLLEQMSLVDKIPYRGAFVSSLTERDIEELHTVRRPLEALAARLLAQHRNSEAIAKLEATLNAMRQAAAAGEQSRMVELDAEFHDSLIALSGHKLLQEIWSTTVGARLRRFLLLKRQRLYQSLAEVAPLHEPIVQAIAAGEVEQAELEAKRHVSKAGQILGQDPETEHISAADKVKL